jgi:hypothetical protein
LTDDYCMTHAITTPYRHDGSKRVAMLLALLLALSSLVFIEPAPYDVCAIAMFVGLLFAGMRLPREIHIALVLLGLFLLGNIIAALLAPEPLETLRSLSIRIYMVMIWIFIVGVVLLDTKRMLTAFWIGYVIAALVAATWGMLEYFGFIDNELWQAHLRAKGPFKDPNVFGPFLVPAAIYCIRQLVSAGSARKVVFAIMFFALSFGILLSFSRGAWINSSIAIGLYTLFVLWTAPSLRVRLQWIVGITLLIIVMAAFLGGAVSQQVVGERFFQRAVLTQKYDIAPDGRLQSQWRALTHSAGDPIGVGPGRSDDEFGLEPHNLYLHVIVEGGWLAARGWRGFLGLTLYRSIPLFRGPPELLQDFFVVFASLAGLLAQSMFIDSTHWRHLWFLAALIWALIIATQRMDSPAKAGFTT